MLPLRLALNDQVMLGILEPLISTRVADWSLVGTLNIEVLRQRKSRCVIAYRMTIHDHNQECHLPFHVIGKIFKGKKGEEVHANMKKLWKGGFGECAPDGLSIPEPLAYLPGLSMLVQTEVPGRQAGLLLKTQPTMKLVRQLARTLGKLHSASITPPRHWKFEDHILRCHPAPQVLTAAYPSIQKKVDYLLDSTRCISESFSHVPLAPVHGDFHLGQVHLHDNRSWLLDLDGLGLGDPALDLGNVIISLRGKLKKLPEQERPAYIEGFYQEYFQEMDPDIAQRIPLYEALSYLRRCCKKQRTSKVGWKDRVNEMMKNALACIDRLENNRLGETL